MGRGRDFRETSRRGYGNDFGDAGPEMPQPSGDRAYGGGYAAPVFAPRPSARPAAGPSAGGAVVDAVVKWFNVEKGFGFVEILGGSGDAFIHIRAVEAAGRADLQPGTTLTVRTGQGQKGLQVSEIVSVDESTATASAPRSSFGGSPRGGNGSAPRASGPSTELTGTVKWYNPDKGFGFVSVGDGGRDVFVHRSVLERANLHDLIEGQAVRMGVVDGQKGREAASIAVG